MIHIYPNNDIKEHDFATTCECQPNVIEESGELICIHNSYDGREGLEMANELLKFK